MIRNKLLENMFQMKNKTDCDKLAQEYKMKINNKEITTKLSDFWEAMYLYNMYFDALDGNMEAIEYLYPYKLSKIIEIANDIYHSNGDKPVFYKVNRKYAFAGNINLNQLDELLYVIIHYADISFLISFMNKVIPLLKEVKITRNLFISLTIMKEFDTNMPSKIGQYFISDYLLSCVDRDFYQDAYLTILKMKALYFLPLKAKANYFELPKIIDALRTQGVFDFGSVVLLCFKIIEITLKNQILLKSAEGLSNREIFESLPKGFQEHYNEDKFSLNLLELGKIYILIEQSFNYNSPFYTNIQKIMGTKENTNQFILYFHPNVLKRYRNPAAHCQYMPEELAREALEILDSFIMSGLPSLNLGIKRANNSMISLPLVLKKYVF